jgi:hypothetical protein
MTRSSLHDPVALFAFALRENDWVLADLIAASLAKRPAARERLLLAVREEASARASPSSLTELNGWARMSRRLGIGDGEDANGEEDPE